MLVTWTSGDWLMLVELILLRGSQGDQCMVYLPIHVYTVHCTWIRPGPGSAIGSMVIGSMG